MMLDRFFRPKRWASRLFYALGLQTARPVRIDEHVLQVARAPGAPPLRVAFATDFHAGATTSDNVLVDACAALERIQADVLLLGGDFVSVRGDDIHVLAGLGKFAVFGNHDLRANQRIIAQALDKAGVELLVNETVRLPEPHDDVTITGLDDPIRGTPRGEILDNAAGVRILLMHAPDGLLTVGDRHFDLAVAGHTHGGQITFGGLMPYLPYGKLSREYAVGLYRLGAEQNRTFIVSRGVGCSTVPVRAGSPAEVHVITLTSAE